jgi:Fur family transcriptional regulator, ferric uptake regulator
VELTTGKLEKVLRDNGYRLTDQRMAVLRVITSTHDHLTPVDVHRRVRSAYPTIGIVTIYRMLDVLFRLKLICRVHAQGECRSYLLRRPEGHHHHLVCSSCGTVVDITSCDITGLEKKISRQTGFQIQGHLLEFQGLCHNCQITG